MPNTSNLSLLADLLYPIQIGKGSPPADPMSAEYDWHLIAEGDSWFSIGGIPSSNVLADLRLPRWTQVLNVAAPGDTIKNMSDILSNPAFKKYVAKKNFAYAFHGLLLSAGGNDLIDQAGKVIIPKQKGADADDPASYIDQQVLEGTLQKIVEDIGTMHQLWNSKASRSSNRPIIMHTYDYATPRNAPSLFLGGAKLSGPWIYNALLKHKLPIDLQQRISDLMFNALADTLMSLDSKSGHSNALTNMHVVDTRNTLVRANPTEVGNSNDWLNEIHPNAGGYRKIAARLSERIATVLSS